MGSVNNQRRLQIRFSKNASIFGHKKDFYKQQKFGYFRNRNSVSYKQKCYRNSTPKRATERFLQFIVPCTQKERGMEDSNKFTTTEPVYSKTAFQNGHIKQSHKSGEARRLGNFSRFERCISSHSHLSKTQKISKVLGERESVPISNFMFRSDVGTKSVYQGSVSGSCLSETAKHKAGNLSRRLVRCQSNKDASYTRSRNDLESSCQTRFYNKSNKIYVSSKSTNNIHRQSIKTRSRTSVSNSREVGRLVQNHSKFITRPEHSQRLPQIAGNHSILSRINSECEIVHETYPTSLTEVLEPIKNEHGSQNRMYSSSKIASKLVVGFSKHYEGSLLTIEPSNSNTNHGCVINGLGSSYEQSCYSRNMVRSYESSAHKQSGVGSSISSAETFFAPIEKQTCTYSLGQYHSGSVHQQTRGDPFFSTLSTNLESLVTSTRESDFFDSSSYSRGERMYWPTS